MRPLPAVVVRPAAVIILVPDFQPMMYVSHSSRLADPLFLGSLRCRAHGTFVIAAVITAYAISQTQSMLRLGCNNSPPKREAITDRAVKGESGGQCQTNIPAFSPPWQQKQNNADLMIERCLSSACWLLFHGYWRLYKSDGYMFSARPVCVSEVGRHFLQLRPSLNFGSTKHLHVLSATLLLA